MMIWQLVQFVALFLNPKPLLIFKLIQMPLTTATINGILKKYYYNACCHLLYLIFTKIYPCLYISAILLHNNMNREEVPRWLG